MVLTVGVSGSSASMQKLMESKLSTGLPNINVKGLEKGYLRIDTAGKKEIFTLCDILADIIVENIQIKMLVNDMQKTYEFIPEKDKVDILVSAIKRLWYPSGSTEYLKAVKKDISNRVALCAFESKGVLNLDGIVLFRMQDYVELWRDALDDCVDEYIQKNEEQEYINLLRYFVSIKEPLKNIIYISETSDSYILKDEFGKTMPIKTSPEENVYGENLLLSKLIDLSPENIIIEESFSSKELKRLISRIFVGRVRQNH